VPKNMVQAMNITVKIGKTVLISIMVEGLRSDRGCIHYLLFIAQLLRATIFNYSLWLLVVGVVRG
jgi:hypothetical protein